MKERGFTLLEVLVATLIMSIAVAGLMSGISLSMRNAGRVTEYDRATLLAKRKMDELLIQKRLPKGVPLEGEFDAASGGGELKARWRAVVTPFEIPRGAAASLWYTEQIHLEVAWTGGGRPRQVVLDGYRRDVLRQEDVEAGWVPK